jgi:hypothetical protein
MMFRGRRVSDRGLVEGYFFVWRRYGKDIPVIGDGVQNGAVNADEVDPATVAPLFTQAAQPAPDGCTCNDYQLENYGCKCGAS